MALLSGISLALARAWQDATSEALLWAALVLIAGAFAAVVYQLWQLLIDVDRLERRLRRIAAQRGVKLPPAP